MLNAVGDGGEQIAMVNSAEGMHSAVQALRYQTLGIGVAGGQQHGAKHVHGQIWHVAGDQQVPIGLGEGESGVESADGPTTGNEIGNDRNIQEWIALGRTNDDGVLDHTGQFGDGAFKQSDTFALKKGFIAAHTGAEAAGQHPGLRIFERKRGAAAHEMMVASVRPSPTSIRGHWNKKVYICSLLAFAIVQII